MVKKRYNQIIGKKGDNGHICRMVILGQMVVKWSRNGGKMVCLGKRGLYPSILKALLE